MFWCSFGKSQLLWFPLALLSVTCHALESSYMTYMRYILQFFQINASVRSYADFEMLAIKTACCWSSHIDCLRQPCTKTSQSAGRVSSLPCLSQGNSELGGSRFQLRWFHCRSQVSRRLATWKNNNCSCFFRLNKQFLSKKDTSSVSYCTSGSRSKLSTTCRTVESGNNFRST